MIEYIGLAIIIVIILTFTDWLLKNRAKNKETYLPEWFPFYETKLEYTPINYPDPCIPHYEASAYGFWLYR